MGLKGIRYKSADGIQLAQNGIMIRFYEHGIEHSVSFEVGYLLTNW